MKHLLLYFLLAINWCAYAQNPCNLSINVETGACTGPSSYEVWIIYTTPAPSITTQFTVYANGQNLGTFAPNNTGKIYIPNFPYNGGANDVVKVCLSTQPNCCVTKEFPVPACLNPLNCQIDLLTMTGNCTGDSTYQLHLQVQIVSPISSAHQYEVWVNGQSVGIYPITQQSISLPNTKWNGGNYDVVKVCLIGLPGCCKEVEYLVPSCLIQSPPPCMPQVSVVTGDCTGDSSYQLTVFTQFIAASVTQTWTLWHNGVQIGTYPASQQSVVLNNAQWNGGPNDFVKVCISNLPNCCAIIEYAVPGCLFQTPCEIDDLKIQKSPCLCGQFFAVIHFETNQPATGQFTVHVSGTNYGTYSYGQLPVIIGPLNGNNTTQYKFTVRDLADADCAEEENIGLVHCPLFASFNPVMRVSPNPAVHYIQVDFPDAATDANAILQVSNHIGQVVLEKQLNYASTSFCDISTLAEGRYQVNIIWSKGSATAQFVKAK